MKAVGSVESVERALIKFAVRLKQQLTDAAQSGASSIDVEGAINELLAAHSDNPSAHAAVSHARHIADAFKRQTAAVRAGQGTTLTVSMGLVQQVEQVLDVALSALADHAASERPSFKREIADLQEEIARRTAELEQAVLAADLDASLALRRAIEVDLPARIDKVRLAALDADIAVADANAAFAHRLAAATREELDAAGGEVVRIREALAQAQAREAAVAFTMHGVDLLATTALTALKQRQMARTELEKSVEAESRCRLHRFAGLAPVPDPTDEPMPIEQRRAHAAQPRISGGFRATGEVHVHRPKSSIGPFRPVEFTSGDTYKLPGGAG